MASDLVLVIEGGERDGERVPLTAPRLTVGRAPGSDLLLKHTSVSGKHALLKCEGEELEIEDLGSTNGTFVAGERVQSARVRVGESFQIGKVRLRFERAGDLESSVPASTSPSGSPAASASGPPARAAAPGASAPSRAASSADDRGAAASHRSEELKALAIGGAGAALVVVLGFFVLRGESRATRQASETDEDPPSYRVTLGNDAGFELDERDPGVAWEALPGSSGEALRVATGAAEGQRCLKIALQPALGERYVPSVGVALAPNRIPTLAAGEVLDLEILARAEAQADGAFATRFAVDDDPAFPATVARGALISAAAADESAPNWKRLRLRVSQPELGSGEARFDVGLLGWSERGSAVYFDAARVEASKSTPQGPAEAAPIGGPAPIAVPEPIELDGDGRFHFVWSALGSALVGRSAHRGETRRLAVLRDLVFVPLESARPLWMDPTFAPLLSAGASGERRIPAAYLRDRSAPVDIAWSWRRVARGTRQAIELTLSRKGAGPLPPLSFTLPAPLLRGGEDAAVARFGGDELVANWVLDEDAAARRQGDAYPAVEVSDEAIDGVIGLGFGSFEMRSSLRLDRPCRAETRRIRGGVSVSLHAELGEGESLKILLGPIDAPTDLEVETAKRTAQKHAADNRIGAAVAALRGVLDRAVLVPNTASTRTRPNVDVIVRNQYGPLVKQLQQSMAAAVQRFDEVRRRAEQALEVGSETELSALLTQIEEAQGLAEIYRSTSYGPEIDRLRASLRAGIEAAAAADPRRDARLRIADDLEQRRSLNGESTPSPLAARLRAKG